MASIAAANTRPANGRLKPRPGVISSFRLT